MVEYQCNTQKLVLKDIVELSLQNKNTPLDKKILKEYQLLKELNITPFDTHKNFVIFIILFLV